MALARLVTRTPELAQTLARSLEAAGYSVEFASPDLVSHGVLVGVPLAPADLEVNLDDPSAASSYLMTADGKEISFAYDACEREFVLAPAWRKLKQAFAPVLQSLKREKAPAEEADAPVLATDSGRDSASDLLPGYDSAITTRIEPIAEPVSERLPESMPEPAPATMAQSIYLPEAAVFAGEEPEPGPVEFSGADYFDGQGVRKIAGRERIAPMEASATRQPETASVKPVEAAPEPLPPRTPWLLTAALRAEAARTSLAGHLRTQWQQRRNTLAHSEHRVTRLRGYDLAWLRSVPVAAVITLAFLLGWGYATSQRPTPAPLALNDGERAQQASVVPLPPPKPESVIRPVVASAKPSAAKRTTSRRVDAETYNGEEDYNDIGQDVVVRHYPAKGVQAAANQKTAIKRFSDIE